MLQPTLISASGSIRDVVPLSDGGYAVCAGNAIELYDAAFALRGRIDGESSEHVLARVSDTRFLIHGTSASRLYEARVGGTIQQVDVGDALVYSVVATADGFIARAFDKIVVDHAGARTTLAPEERFNHGMAAWRGGAVVSGYAGITIVGPDGTIVAESTDERLRGEPVALANAIVAKGADDTVVFDERAQVIGRIDREVGDRAFVPYRTGVLVRVYDDDAGTTELSYWTVDGGVEEQWSTTYDELMWEPVVIGDRIVIGDYDDGVHILDGDGAEIAVVPTPRFVQEVAGFAGGIAIYVRNSHEVLWWRPDAEVETLLHDVEPNFVRTVPAGLLTAEGDTLLMWRTDVQGPEVAPVTSDLPMNTWIVIGGSPVQVVAAGRHTLRAKSLGGQAYGISPAASWRPMTTRDEAVQIVERLVGRQFDRPLPALPDERLVYTVEAKLGQLPLAETVDLHGRALFAATTLDSEVRTRSGWARSAFFTELGAALGTSGRVVLAAVKARKVALAPPRPVAAGYDYLGTFTTEGQLTVSDPCYLRSKPTNPAIVFSLSHKVAGLDGTWHVFVRGDHDKPGELVTIHDDGFDVYANEIVASIGVDSGTAGVFDKKCPKRDDDAPFEEGTILGLGAAAWTGRGDGMFPVFVGSAKGRVAKIRIFFGWDDAAIDRSVAKRQTAAKPYTIKTVFTMNDTVEHVKFGTGTVVRVGGDGKIDVSFADGVRTLIHAKK